MGKKRQAFIINCLLICFSLQAFAQHPVNQKQLDVIATQARETFTNDHQKALSIAKSKGWAIRRSTKTGNLVVLQGINKLGFPIYLTTHNNTTAAATTRTNTIQPGGELGLNLAGESTFLNNKLGIWDGGQVYKAHREFSGKTITAKDNAAILDHSAHVAGSMLAKGVYAPARGMAFKAKTLLSWDFDNDVSEMSGAAAGLLLSNHSYGDVGGWDYNTDESRWEWYGLPGDTEDYNFGFYDQRTQSWDKIAYNAPYYLIVESAGNSRASNGPAIGDPYYGFTSRTDGKFIKKEARPANISSNDGYDIITTTGNAKNILTVGSVGPLPNGPANSSDIVVSYFSSWGPTDDGRIKPDIMSDGENILSTGVDNTSSYITLSGTSMAAGNVTGSLYLLQEYYAKKNNGAFMRSATLKGLVCHTAFDAGNAGPDYIYGWGLLDMRKAAQAITYNNNKSIIAEYTLQQGQNKVLEVTASGDGPLIVSISWTDPEGAITAGTKVDDRTPKLVNDLDVRVSDGNSTLSPWVLTPDNPSAPATKGDNKRDNIEQVYIANAVPGKKYTITISHKGTLRSGNQPYSIIVTGAGGHTYCASAPASTADSRINNFTLSNINYTSPAGCTGYANLTNLTVLAEQGKSYPFSITLGTCGNNFNKAAKIFADWNGNGIFEANELAATTNVINGTGTYTGNITVPATVNPGDLSLLRIVLTETTDTATITACGTYGKGETQDYRIQFLKPAIDAGVISVINADALCATATAVTVRLHNYGSKAISNIPVTITITSPNNTVITFNETYTGTLNPGDEADFQFSEKFNAVAGASYNITAEAHLAGDIITSNNKATGIIAIDLSLKIGALSAFYCDNSKQYLLSGTGEGQLIWYKTPTDKVPVGYGPSALVTEPPVNNTYYAGLNDFSGKVGPATKNVFSGGAYNQFTPGIKVNTQVPVIIESARLYIGNSGKIIFTATNDFGEVVSSVTLNVTATRSNPSKQPQPDDPNDQGQVYTLNLSLPDAGNYTITPTYQDNASIFRNNSGVNGYPFTIGNVFSITGNNAVSNDESDSTYYKQFYYYLYDMQVKSPGCASTERKPVTVTKPVVTQNGEVLNSSIAPVSQWLLNGEAIAGADTSSYSPKQSGNYQAEVLLANGCTSLSDPYYYALAATHPNKNTDIGLTVFPVPAYNDLNVVFVAKAAANLQLSLVNTIGQPVYQNTQNIPAGNFSTVINVANQMPGTYILKVIVDKKVYAQKIIIAH